MRRLGAPSPSLSSFGLFAPPHSRVRHLAPPADTPPLFPHERRVLEPPVANAALGRPAGWPLDWPRGRGLRWWMLTISLAVHALVLFWLLREIPDSREPTTTEPPVEMVFQPDSHDNGPGAGTPPSADETPEVNVPLGVSPPVPVPDLPPPPPIPTPDTIPQPQKQQAGSPQGRGRRSGRTESAFSHPMDLSFGPGRSGATTTRRGRPNGPVDLSIGPISQMRAFTENDRSAMIQGATGNYAAILEPWVYRRWKYPMTAVMHGEQGESRIHVRADKDGNILGLWLEGTSGSVALDQAAEDVMRNTRLPKPTPDMLTHGPIFDLYLDMRYILTR